MQPPKPLEFVQFPKTPASITPEAKFWKSFKFPILVGHPGAITAIDFNPVSPHSFAVTSSGQVEIFDPHTNEVASTFTKFKSKAYSARYRNDGKAIVAGTTEGLVRVFDTKTRSVLRDFHGHRGATRVTRFSRDNLTVMSGSDDMTLRAWDLMTAQQLSSMTGHKDYIRAGCIHPSTPDIWASGSYDHTVKLWDMRSNTETTTLNHGAPVEDLLIFPSGGILVSAGGENVKIWDLFKNTLLTTLDGHQKTVTSLYVDNNRSTLFSASLVPHHNHNHLPTTDHQLGSWP